MMPGLALVMLLMALLRLLSMPLLALTLLAMTLLAMTSAKIKLEGIFADTLVLIDAWGEAPLALPSAGSGHGRQNC